MWGVNIWGINCHFPSFFPQYYLIITLTVIAYQRHYYIQQWRCIRYRIVIAKISVRGCLPRVCMLGDRLSLTYGNWSISNTSAAASQNPLYSCREPDEKLLSSAKASHDPILWYCLPNSSINLELGVNQDATAKYIRNSDNFNIKNNIPFTMDHKYYFYIKFHKAVKYTIKMDNIRHVQINMQNQ